MGKGKIIVMSAKNPFKRFPKASPLHRLVQGFKQLPRQEQETLLTLPDAFLIASGSAGKNA